MLFLQHFKLSAQPFAERTAAEALWMDERMRQGVARLRYLAEHATVGLFTGASGVGKSALLNALLGEERFSTSPLHGETRRAQSGRWEAYKDGGIYLVDTPGINEVEGE